jgi:hypothetical protein
MREENYFEKKLATCKETLASAERKLEHLDIQLIKLKERFDHDKKVYDDQVIHMQNIVSDMKKRIPGLEKKIEQGYSTIDIRTGKAYKSFKDRHIGHLEEKREWALENQKLLQENYERKQVLKKKKRDKLKPKELEIIEAEEIRESLQGKDELQEAHERQIEQLQKKADFYQSELEALKETKPKPEKENPIILDNLEKEIEDVVEVLDELKKDEEAEIIEEKPAPPSNLDTNPPPESNKTECPECHEYFTKGGAFAAHYKSHFPNGNSKE